MKRRKFLQLLGITPVAVVAAKYLPKPLENPCKAIQIDPTTVLISDHHFGPVTRTNEDWQPNYCYKAGDKVTVNGEVFMVTWAGVSGGCRPFRKEEFMDKIGRVNPWGTVALKKA